MPSRTESQSEAARRNGAKSRGPVSAGGRARSAGNSLKHGLSAARSVLIPGEDVAEFERHRAAYVERFQPADKVELDLVLRIAETTWRLHRIPAFESALLTDYIIEPGSAGRQHGPPCPRRHHQRGYRVQHIRRAEALPAL